MEFLDYYSILGVSSDATQEQVERAYKLLVRRLHPDTFPNDPEAQAWANERLKQLNLAYEALEDPVRRSEYDRTYPAQRTAHHENSRTQEQRVQCPLCAGTGQITCLTCEGRGGPSCPGCDGEHIVICPICNGAGTLAQQEYERIRQEVVRSEQRASAKPETQDPFWQVGYWDRPATPRPPVALGRPQIAVALSFFIPGAGQFYNREPQKGLLYLGIAFVLIVGAGLLKEWGQLIWLGFWAYNLYDAYSTAKRS